MQGKTSVCVAVWLSGFFGFGAVLHIVRLILRFPVTVGTYEVPLGASVLIAAIAGALSAGLLYCACKKSCSAK